MTLPKGYLDFAESDYSALDVETLRRIFGKMRAIVRYNISDADATIAANNPTTPVEWIMAVKRVNVVCPKCNGSGIYEWGACVNGRMTHSGPCARCGGTGRMTFDDMRRYKAYVGYEIAKAFRS